MNSSLKYFTILFFAFLLLNIGGCKKDIKSFDCEMMTVKDIDGNEYQTVKIGSLCWMQENLKTTKYNNNQSIPTSLTNAEWVNDTEGAMAIYNDDADLEDIYGRIYNWNAVNTGKLCPKGWRVPTEEEWDDLITELGGEVLAGGKLKAVSMLWDAPNTGASNESEFTALPAGLKFNNGSYDLLGEYTSFWSATSITENESWAYSLISTNEEISKDNASKRSGLSCRCVID